MSYPPATISSDERVLGADDISRLADVKAIRKLVSNYKQAVEASEVVTFSPEYGNIYRYDVLGDSVEEPARVRGKLVLIKNSDSDIRLHYYSLFDLESLPGI
jgi:hypothetical protein